MGINPSNLAGKFEYKGRTYYFCSPKCRARSDLWQAFQVPALEILPMIDIGFVKPFLALRLLGQAS